MMHALHGLDAVITDHHVPTEREIPKVLRSDLLRFAESQDRILMLNPHLEGAGSDVASGAGCAYAVAKALDPANKDLASVAIVGAVGDVQDQEFRRLSGYNREILQDGIDAGVLRAQIDLRLFGRETRPAYKMLQYASDPWIPRLSGNEDACIALLLELGIDLKVEDHWRSWSDLDDGEKRRVVTALVAHMLERGCGVKETERLAGETYTLIREPAGSPTRDAKEFGTLVNACGRYDQPEVGYRVCRGDREDSLAEALRLLRGHREYLVDSMEAVAAAGINQMDAIQYFHAADTIRDTVVGIAASMALNRENATKDLPIFAFAQASDGIKVSARTTRELVARGLDLAEVMKVASGAVGGQVADTMRRPGRRSLPGRSQSSSKSRIGWSGIRSGPRRDPTGQTPGKRDSRRRIGKSSYGSEAPLSSFRRWRNPSRLPVGQGEQGSSPPFPRKQRAQDGDGSDRGDEPAQRDGTVRPLRAQ